MYLVFDSIKIWLQADDLGITKIDFVENEPDLLDIPSHLAQQHLLHAKRELMNYFKGTLSTFTVPIHFLTGTPFQQRVWQSLLTIPYGDIKNYQDIAIQVGSPKAQQAVGQANRNNPIPIIVPCHRVIGKNGKLVGYSGNSQKGLEVKQRLLNIEKKRG